jgi:cyclase
MEQRGAGEILLQSIDRDGTQTGYDLELVKRVAEAVSIPVVAAGGAGAMRHFREAVDAGASAAAAGSYFVFHGKHRAVLITYPEYHELRELFSDE